jgi:glycosyltransferase involved in cell wall biosynthesis
LSINYPKITIVTPNFNQGAFLEKTILSVLSQNYPNLEYIIIDGGSTDDSGKIIEKYAHNLAYWISEKDKGQYDAVNKGFLKSTGDIMSYLNSDDLLSSNSLFSVAQIFTDYKQVEWLGGIAHMIDEDDRSVFVGAHNKWNKAKYLKKEFKYIQQEGMFWSRNIWVKAGSKISTDYLMASDLELWSRFFLLVPLYVFPGFLGSFRLRLSNQKTLTLMDLYDQEAINILDNLPRSKQEVDFLKKSNTLTYKYLLRINSKLLFKWFGYEKVNLWLNNFPAQIHFERLSKKFIIND